MGGKYSRDLCLHLTSKEHRRCTASEDLQSAMIWRETGEFREKTKMMTWEGRCPLLHVAVPYVRVQVTSIQYQRWSQRYPEQHSTTIHKSGLCAFRKSHCDKARMRTLCIYHNTRASNILWWLFFPKLMVHPLCNGGRGSSIRYQCLRVCSLCE